MDWALDPTHDLSDPQRQKLMQQQLSRVDFIAAAFDCSTKSRAREIPRKFEDGRPAPRPLRSEAHPDGLPGLTHREQQRVDRDNQASSFILDEISSSQGWSKLVGLRSVKIPYAASIGILRKRLPCGSQVVGRTSNMPPVYLPEHDVSSSG